MCDNDSFMNEYCVTDRLILIRTPLQHAATHCNILQQTAPHCTTLHRTRRIHMCDNDSFMNKYCVTVHSHMCDMSYIRYPCTLGVPSRRRPMGSALYV